MKEHQQSYEKIEPHESSSGLSDDANLDAFELRIQRLKTNHHKIRRLLIANVIILCLSVAVLLAAKFYSTPSTKQFVEKFSSYSPAREAVKYVSGTFNATQGEASGYVGTSNETEEMWDWVTRDIGDQMITTEELKLINKPEDSLKTKDPKSGKEGYRVGLEVFHQLHCLNMIRKSTFREFYDGKGDFAEKDDGKIRTHLSQYSFLDLSSSRQLKIFRSLSRNASHEYHVSSRHWSYYVPRSTGQPRGPMARLQHKSCMSRF